MPRRYDSEHDWDDNLDLDDDPVDQDDDEDSTIPCPQCGREIHDESERCPYCGNYVSHEDTPPAPKPWWVVMGVLACLYVVYRWIIWW